MSKAKESESTAAPTSDANGTVIELVPDPAAAPRSGPLDATVDAWFAKHFHNNGPLFSERAYNLIHAAKEDLKAELRTL